MIAKLQLRRSCQARSYLSFPLALLVLVTACSAAPAVSSQVLTTVQQVRSLLPDQAKRRMPVRLRGVVTALSGWKNSFFLQDAGGAISIDRNDQEPQLEPGDRIEIAGASGPGLFAPVVISDSVRILGTSALPPAHVFQLAELMNGKQDSRRVALRAVIRSSNLITKWGRSMLSLRLEDATGLITASVVDFQGDFARLVDAEVMVTGICATNFNDHGQLVGVLLFVNSLKDVLIEKAAPADPFAAPREASNRLFGFGHILNPNHRVRLRGTLTLQRLGKYLYIQENGHGIQVHTTEMTAAPPGAQIEAVGFASLGDTAPVLDDAIFRVLPGEVMVSPVRVRADQVMQRKDGFWQAPQNNLLVTVRATLLERIAGAQGRILELSQGSAPFTASLPAETGGGKEMRSLKPGAIVDVTGICYVRRDTADDPISYQLLLRSPEDIHIVQDLPWWTLVRVLYALAGTALIAALAFSAILILRRRLKRQILEMSHQTRLVSSIVASMADGVIATDEKGQVLLANPTAARLLPNPTGPTILSPEGVAKLGLGYWLSEEKRPYPTDQLPLLRALRGETVDACEIFVTSPERPNGIWMNSTARPMTDQDGVLRGVVLVFRDITEQRASREALSRAKDEAEAANRAKSEFLSRMSHELRTPLNAILGFAQLLEDEVSTDDQRDSIARILTAGRHLLGLINEVLDISKIEAGGLTMQVERLRPEEVIHAALELVDPLAAQRHMDILLSTSCNLDWRINVDRQHLTQVLVNLLGNAIKYGNERSTVRVSLEERSAEWLRINIADCGKGIAPEQLSKLFVPFERLGAEHSGIEGSGLGLVYAKRLVSAMRGRIGVESELGKGSVFWVEIPLLRSEQQSEQRPVAASHGKAFGTTRDSGLVLCIQSDSTTLREIEAVFDQLPGYSLISAAPHSIELEELLEREPELVILDLQMSDTDGMELIKQLRSRLNARQTPIIVVSAELTEEMKHRALNAGAYSCLAKPLKVRSFVDAISCLI